MKFFKNWHILVCKKHFQDEYISFPQIKYKTLSKLDQLQTQSILGKSHILFTLSSGTTQSEPSINVSWVNWMVVTMIYIMNLMRPSSCSFNWTYLFSWHQDIASIFIFCQRPTISLLHHPKLLFGHIKNWVIGCFSSLKWSITTFHSV